MGGKQTLNYIDLSLNVVYETTCSSGSFYGGLGPGVGFGIGGKWKYKEMYGSTTYTEDGSIKFGNDENEDHYKALQVSGNVLAGYQLKNGVFGELNYNIGINNIAIENGAKARGSYGAFKLGFRF